jgi:hypothetical protein
VRQPPEVVKRYRIPIGLVTANLVFAAVFIAVALSAFHRPVPHRLPVGVVAPAPAAHRLEHSVDTSASRQFDLRPYRNERLATTAIAHRRLDGAVVISAADTRILIARAGGTASAQALTAAFTAAAAQDGQRATVVDVVPPKTGDSQALAPFFVILCVLFPSLAIGSACAHLLRNARATWRVAVPLAAAVAIGLTIAAIADDVTGLGSYLPVAGIVALFSLAVSLPTAALGQIKTPLVAVAITVLLIFGIPASGGPAGLSAFGPGFLRALNPVLPLGVAVNAVRNTVYFGGHDTAGHLLVLAAWAAAGLAILALQRRPSAAGRAPLGLLARHYGLQVTPPPRSGG